MTLTADTVLVNGVVYAVDDDFSTAEAVAVRGEQIVFVGSTDDAMRLAGDETRVVDLEGRTVLPGFTDSHLHPVYSGKNLEVAVQLTGSKSLAEALERIKERAAELEPGEWLRGSNHWSIDALEEGRLPYRHELDEAAPDNPFWVNVAFHRAAANSRALEAAGIDRDTPESFGHGTGWVFKDEHGEPSGHLLESAMFAVMQQQPLESEEIVLAAVERVQDLFVENGITSVIDQGDVGPPFRNFPLMQRLWREGRLKLRWRMNHIGFEMAQMPVEAIHDHVATLRNVSGFGDDWLRMGAIGELVLDGFVEDHWSRAPYGEDHFGHGWCGIRLYNPDTILAICRAAAAHGLQMNVHCSGDGALDAALEAFEQIHGDAPISGLRWSLEHGGMNPTEANLRACRDLGIVVGTQQPLQYWHSKDIIAFYGREAEVYFPNRTWWENGIVLRGGSDFDTAPLSPLLGIWTILTRRTITGDVIGADQALPREEAVRMYTRNAAWSVFEEGRKGSLEPGKLADLVVLSGDLMAVPEDEIKDLEVLATVVGGQASYDPSGLLGKAVVAA
jgi:predicted amidohydrolase YtcJ